MSIGSDTHLRKYFDAAEIIQKNLDLEDKLNQVRDEAKRVGTSYSLNKDQKDLLRMHGRCNRVISIADLKLLEVAVHVLKRLSKCVRPDCATCCYVKAHTKTGRSKGKHNKAILDRMKKLSRSISYADIMTSSFPGLIPQIVGFLT